MRARLVRASQVWVSEYNLIIYHYYCTEEDGDQDRRMSMNARDRDETRERRYSIHHIVSGTTKPNRKQVGKWLIRWNASLDTGALCNRLGPNIARAPTSLSLGVCAYVHDYLQFVCVCACPGSGFEYKNMFTLFLVETIMDFEVKDSGKWGGDGDGCWEKVKKREWIPDKGIFTFSCRKWSSRSVLEVTECRRQVFKRVWSVIQFVLGTNGVWPGKMAFFSELLWLQVSYLCEHLEHSRQDEMVAQLIPALRYSPISGHVGADQLKADLGSLSTAK